MPLRPPTAFSDARQCRQLPHRYAEFLIQRRKPRFKLTTGNHHRCQFISQAINKYTGIFHGTVLFAHRHGWPNASVGLLFAIRRTFEQEKPDDSIKNHSRLRAYGLPLRRITGMKAKSVTALNRQTLKYFIKNIEVANIFNN